MNAGGLFDPLASGVASRLQHHRAAAARRESSTTGPSYHITTALIEHESPGDFLGIATCSTAQQPSAWRRWTARLGTPVVYSLMTFVVLRRRCLNGWRNVEQTR
jgi:hypothetical protein